MKIFVKILSAALILSLCLGGAALAAESGAGDLFTDRDYRTDYADYVTVTLSDGGTSADGAGVSIAGNTVTITAEGTYLLTGTLTDGQIVVNAGDAAKVQLVLDNASVTCQGGAALYVASADKVFVTTAAGSENLLASAGEFIQTDDNNVDGAVFSKSDLTLNGEGSLTVKSETGHGIVCKDDLKLTGGAYSVTAARDGLAANDSVRIAGGNITIRSGSDGIDCSSDDAEKGWVYIGGGTLTITAGDDGVHASSTLTVEDGTIAITAYEGLEGVTVLIAGGDIDLITRDDGVNATSGANPSITVSGGVLTVDSGGDSLDANGSLYVTGGEITITGPSMSGNGILDYDFTGTVTGGTLLATGVSGMQVNFGQSSTQGSILYSLPAVQAAGTAITLTDSAGNVIAKYTARADFQVVLLSTPEIVSGETYTLTVGGEEYAIEMTSLTYGAGMGFGGFGGASRGPWGGF